MTLSGFILIRCRGAHRAPLLLVIFRFEMVALAAALSADLRRTPARAPARSQGERRRGAANTGGGAGTETSLEDKIQSTLVVLSGNITLKCTEVYWCMIDHDWIHC